MRPVAGDATKEAERTTKRVGIIMNGVSGRMGRNQHLGRSIAAIRSEGGIRIDGLTIWPDPILVGRDNRRLRELALEHGLERYSTDLYYCLKNPDDTVYFDSQTTAQREHALALAIAAGKDVYCEKPTATSSLAALGLAKLAEEKGVHNGAVQDKLFLPGIVKLADVIRSGALGKIFAVRIDFGYWVFGDEKGVGQRPSWNYRAEDGGGIVLDMFCHFRYLLDHLFGAVQGVMCETATHVAERVDERGHVYSVTAEDSAYALVTLHTGALAQVHASWCVRPYRDDLFSIQVDGSTGSAVADLRRCFVQSSEQTPTFTWNPDVPQELDPRGSWTEFRPGQSSVNAFRQQWELFLRHIVLGDPFPWDLRASARGVQFAELAMRSAREHRWLDVHEL
jgi:predicted dehydrogenase